MEKLATTATSASAGQEVAKGDWCSTADGRGTFVDSDIRKKKKKKTMGNNSHSISPEGKGSHNAWWLGAARNGDG